MHDSDPEIQPQARRGASVSRRDDARDPTQELVPPSSIRPSRSYGRQRNDAPSDSATLRQASRESPGSATALAATSGMQRTEVRMNSCTAPYAAAPWRLGQIRA